MFSAFANHCIMSFKTYKTIILNVNHFSYHSSDFNNMIENNRLLAWEQSSKDLWFSNIGWNRFSN